MTDPKVADFLERARTAASAEEALTLTLAAISRAPDSPDAYALRALLAVAQDQPAVAAHYFRVAYGRGHRSVETRMGLATSWRIAGDAKGADAIAQGHALPRVLQGFAKAATWAAAQVSAVLAGPLPQPGIPAWHADDVARIGHAAPPRVAPQPTAPSGSALGPVIRIQAGPRPDWVEVVDTFSRGSESGRPSWLEDTSGAHPCGARQGGPVAPVEAVMDPGVSSVSMISPVTGRAVPVPELADTYLGATMGNFDVPRSLLEARAALLPLVGPETPIRMALQLPGPVMTEAGKPPTKLCETVVLGLTDEELIVQDGTDARAVPARIALCTLTQMDAVADGFQVSLTLGEGRQIHLDLRSLKQEASRVADSAIRVLAETLGALR